jgi:hypothetical protein
MSQTYLSGIHNLHRKLGKLHKHIFKLLPLNVKGFEITNLASY